MSSSRQSLAKSRMREQLRQQRRELPAPARASAARALRDQLCRLPLFSRSRDIAVYSARDGEIDLTPVINACWKAGKRLYLPALDGSELRFLRYRRGDRLRPNRWQIPEPGPRSEQREATGLDLIIAPLVAFDRRGNRLGMGGGYYDRTLARVRRGGPRLVGAAYRFQEVGSLPAEGWDIAMHAIITERGLIVCEGRAR